MILEKKFIIPETPNSHLEFKFFPIDLLTYWQRCGMTADYIAKFFTPIIGEIKSNSLSTIVNELIENSCKYTTSKEHPVEQKIIQYGEIIASIGKNYVNKKTKDNFGKFVKRINSMDVEKFYFETLEFRVVGEKHSRLGFVTLIKDYNVDINYWFDQISEDLFACEISAVVNFSSL